MEISHDVMGCDLRNNVHVFCLRKKPCSKSYSGKFAVCDVVVICLLQALAQEQSNKIDVSGGDGRVSHDSIDRHCGEDPLLLTFLFCPSIQGPKIIINPTIGRHLMSLTVFG